MTTEKSILNAVDKAARQTAVRHQLLGSWHGDILGPEWTIERAVALPMVPALSADAGDICETCRPYLLDRARLDQGLEDWLKGASSPPAYPVGQQYKNFLIRDILSFSFKLRLIWRSGIV